jgi:hypothetical protein
MKEKPLNLRMAREPATGIDFSPSSKKTGAGKGMTLRRRWGRRAEGHSLIVYIQTWRADERQARDVQGDGGGLLALLQARVLPVGS